MTHDSLRQSLTAWSMRMSATQCSPAPARKAPWSVFDAPGSCSPTRQTSRNVVLGDEARITTRPQLEIYADDVKCSHGATVGQMDEDALLYMRQRGLSEAQARALLMEGFVADVVRRCGVEQLREVLMRGVGEKLERM